LLPLIFDRVPDGAASTWLADAAPGSSLTFGAPQGHFCLPQPAPRRLLLAAHFTGIVPLRAVLQEIDALPHARLPRVTLLYGAERQEDLIFHDELSARAMDSSFEYIPTLHEADAEWSGEIGLEPEVLARRIHAKPGDYPMVCGLKGFCRAIRALLVERGFDRREVQLETYD
jgi:NAD(P)H-flavin reductase